MENNENMNNQINSNTQPVQNKNSNNALFIIMAILILGLAGYIVYTKFIQKGDEPKSDNTTPSPVVTPTSNVAAKDIDESYGEIYKTTKKEIYKSKDGKNELRIEPQTDDPNYDYYAYFNNKKLMASVSKTGKYLLVEVNEAGESSQCSQKTYIVNSENNTLVDLYSNNLYNIVKINDKCYFIEYICATSYVAVYDENLNKIGTNMLGHDQKYFYILDGNIVKYDSNGKEVFRSSESYLSNSKEYNFDSLRQEDNILYILLVSGKDIYFIDTSNDDLKPIKVGTTDEYNCYIGMEDLIISPAEDGKININLLDKQNKSLDIVYDTKTKTITK